MSMWEFWTAFPHNKVLGYYVLPVGGHCDPLPRSTVSARAIAQSLARSLTHESTRLGTRSRGAAGWSSDAKPRKMAEPENTRKPRARWPPEVLETLPPSLRPAEGETLDLLLHKKVLLLQERRGYRCNTDSMLLPFFAHERCCQCRPPVRVADLGAGTGMVGIAAARQWPSAAIDLYERQPALAALCRRNVALNGLAPVDEEPAPEHRARVLECDLAAGIERGIYDGVLCNPPYYEYTAAGERCAPGNQQKRDAHFESTLSIAGFVRVLAESLKLGGRGWLVYDRSGVARLASALEAERGRLRCSVVVLTPGGGSGSRLLLEVERVEEAEDDLEDTTSAVGTAAAQHEGGPALPAAFEARLAPPLVLHAEARPDGDRYAEPIEAWLDGLPPCHLLGIRTPGM